MQMLECVQTGGFRVQNASLKTDIAKNDVKFNFIVKDSVNTDRHGINGDLALVDNRYQLRLREGLLIDYRKWATDSEGYIQYAPDSVLVKNFVIRQDYQSLRSTRQPMRQIVRWILLRTVFPSVRLWHLLRVTRPWLPVH